MEAVDKSTVVASFGRFHVTTTRALWQYDYGIKLLFDDLDLPSAYAVHFSNHETDGEAMVQVGGADGVMIPDALLQTGNTVYAWIYLHTGSEDGETVYKAKIPVQKRPQPGDAPPTPEEQGMIDQAVEILNDAIDEAQGAVEEAQSHAHDSEAWAVGTRNGEAVADDDETFQNNSAYYAALAAQAAGNAGYMDFEINEDGDLIYTHTDAVSVDFELRDGYLYMGVI